MKKLQMVGYIRAVNQAPSYEWWGEKQFFISWDYKKVNKKLPISQTYEL